MRARPSLLLQVILAGAVALGAGAASGQTAPASSADPAPVTTAAGGDLRHAQRAGEQFGSLAGSRENTEALALALRTGSEATLVGADGTVTAFTPATGHMGHGNVSRSLALAQRQLAALGITDPTPQEIAAALNGGPVTVGSGVDARTVEMQGILRLRADGMGWGEIAHTVGLKPGQSFKPMSTTYTDPGAAPHGGTQRVRVEDRVGSRSESRGVVTAAGGTVSGGAVADRKGGGHEIAQRHGGRALGSGIVTAGGAPAVGGQVARGGGHGIQRAGGAGAVHNGGGRQAASGSGVVSAAGNTTMAMNAGSRPGGGNGGGNGPGGGKR